MGADIVVGEGQSFGVPVAFGGPSLGLFGCKEKFTRQLPGRLVGKTEDTAGNTGFVLTLATREQHIRREKATSNICTNVGLNALAATFYMSLLGKRGLKKLAVQNNSRMQFFLSELKNISGFQLKFTGKFFNEVAVKCPKPAKEIINEIAAKKQIIPGVDLGGFHPQFEDTLLVCITEVHTKEQITNLLEAFQSI